MDAEGIGVASFSLSYPISSPLACWGKVYRWEWTLFLEWGCVVAWARILHEALVMWEVDGTGLALVEGSTRPDGNCGGGGGNQGRRPRFP